MKPLPPFLGRLVSDYGMLLVLLLLAVAFSVLTWDEQHPGGEAGGLQLADEIQEAFDPGTPVLIAARETEEDAAFASALESRLSSAGYPIVAVVRGGPADARRALEKVVDGNLSIGVIACNRVTSTWGVFESLGSRSPSLSDARIVAPRSHMWPNFLKADNLLNITNQIAVIAILAIGMTLVILTGGIDLSVGSLIALSAVISALLIRDAGGAQEASAAAMILCCLAGILACGLAGAATGAFVTFFRIPPFIMTLGMMLIARGAAYTLSDGQSNNQVPDSFVWLGVGADFFGIPNAVVLMLALYALAYVLTTRMTLGRYIYAVGGNAEAARLSGVPVRGVLMFVYTVCGALAGLGGIVLASQLKSGDPKYGMMAELDVIAAVVVGGTSLAGGQGRILGTLIGAFIIAVINNGMNLMGVGSYTQMIVLGSIIPAAVLLDKLKRKDRG